MYEIVTHLKRKQKQTKKQNKTNEEKKIGKNRPRLMLRIHVHTAAHILY